MTRLSRHFVEKELSSLNCNKATGLDQLAACLLKDSAFYISKPICYILNMLITTGTVPKLWKSAKFMPILKSRSAELPQNYRPISVLPVLSKILEKSIHSQLLSYLERNKLLSEYQFGFRKHRSTKMAATLLCDHIRKEMNNGNMVGVIYLDLSKAFDTIGHGLLINKLTSYGVSGHELEWFTD